MHNENITATVSDMGAELISMKKGGQEYIWTGDPAYWNGHNPILFPVIGFLKDGKTCFDGEEYPLPKHGYARKSLFSLVRQSEDSITLAMTDTPNTREGFPFAFRFEVTHTLTDDGFTTAFRVENRSYKMMPFMLGGHTGFCLPFTEGSAFSDHTLVFEKSEHDVTLLEAVNGQLIEDPIGRPDYMGGSNRIELSYPLFDKDALILKGLVSRKVKLCDKNGKGVEMDFDGFDLLGIWTPPGKEAPFLCIEPWNGVNAYLDEAPEFGEKPHIRKVAPNGCYTVSYSVRIL